MRCCACMKRCVRSYPDTQHVLLQLHLSFDYFHRCVPVWCMQWSFPQHSCCIYNLTKMQEVYKDIPSNKSVRKLTSKTRNVSQLTPCLFCENGRLLVLLLTRSPWRQFAAGGGRGLLRRYLQSFSLCARWIQAVHVKLSYHSLQLSSEKCPYTTSMSWQLRRRRRRSRIWLPMSRLARNWALHQDCLVLLNMCVEHVIAYIFIYIIYIVSKYRFHSCRNSTWTRYFLLK